MAELFVYPQTAPRGAEGSGVRWPPLVNAAIERSSALGEILERWRTARARLGLSPAAETLGAVLLVSELSSGAYAALVGEDSTRRAPARSHLLEATREILDETGALEGIVELEQRGVVRILEGSAPWFAGEMSMSVVVHAHCVSRTRSSEGRESELSVRALERSCALSLRVAERIDEAVRFVCSVGEERVLFVVRGRRGSGRDTAVRLLLGKLGRRALRRAPFELRGESGSLELELSHAAAVWDARRCDPSPEDRELAARWLMRALGASVAVLDRDQDPPDLDRLVFLIEVDAGSREEREQMWLRALTRLAAEPAMQAARQLAARTRAGAGLAVRAVQMLEPSRLGVDDIVAGVEHALLVLGRQSSTRGVIVEHPVIAWSKLIVSAATAAALEQVLCLARIGGARDNGHKGLRALFSGSSGTGKTLAARAIATALGLPLYRVDLATVVSKWVGETEKNLRQVLAAAEAAGAVLFFDEGDALLSKRGDVARGSDRYANHEVSYLLQALESHDGIVLVATNLKHSLDPAFCRRFDVSVEFALPAAAERLKLWEQELGADPARELGSKLLDELAVPELSGGNIAGAARLAAAISHGRGEDRLNASDVRLAVAAEFYKIGSAVQGAQWTARANRGAAESA